jgi:hypothetical protein
MINMSDLTDEFASPAAALKQSNSFAVRCKAVLARASSNLLLARQAQAERYVQSYFARQDDAGLQLMGMCPAEIASVRAGTWQSFKRDHAA